MDFFEAIQLRRSVRQYSSKTVDESIIQKSFEAAVRAPNSSNLQTWNFYWVKSTEKKSLLVKASLDQSAARTAAELVVVSADPKLWLRSQKPLLKWALDANAPKPVHDYYQKLIPVTYRWGFLNCWAPLKWLVAQAIGLFRPFMKGPFTRRDLQEVAIKSAALASENFVLSLAAQGVSSCMMEGFDESRIKKILNLKSSARIVMVIAIGYAADRGTWGPQWRLPLKEVVHQI